MLDITAPLMFSLVAVWISGAWQRRPPRGERREAAARPLESASASASTSAQEWRRTKAGPAPRPPRRDVTGVRLPPPPPRPPRLGALETPAAGRAHLPPLSPASSTPSPSPTPPRCFILL
ncbi:uncharacterized protein LOC126092871 [Schistocerca cancellata]|uniref:uncharacterized protein LOC126092871 n=1 Tax=Schistocerca cancellata TaxID=274614 RepID=UPI0021180ADB|nr:uncharacterized protein LOC126092871 [Schistocerca cancellata]